MISTERDNPRVILAVDGNWSERLPSDRVVTQRRERRTLEESFVAVLNLLNSVVIVVRGNWDITAIHNFQTRLEGVNFQRNVVPAIKS